MLGTYNLISAKNETDDVDEMDIDKPETNADEPKSGDFFFHINKNIKVLFILFLHIFRIFSNWQLIQIYW